MDFSICPICNLSLPSSQIQRHANEHFSDEDYYATDLELAHQVSLTPPSPPPIMQAENPRNDRSCSFTRVAEIAPFEISSNSEKYNSIVSSQKEEKFYRVEGNLMNLLKRCLELEPGNSETILSKHVDHFESMEYWDVGWGCGWRNIQMLSSYLLNRREEARSVLYGGCGFVPNIPSLQNWLELAWEKGFDTEGSDDFDRKIKGKRTWIGTTECASLFRFFGLRARIVDFCSKDFEIGHLVETKEKAYGPMDTFLSKGKIDTSKRCGKSNASSEEVRAHQVIFEWVWNYFSVNHAGKSYSGRVVLSEKSPLYFQHDGHSRTIVGIQARHLNNGTKHYNLLIFDPSDRTRALEKSLSENNGWQKLIKRGAHTLREPQYQLCYVDPGIARGEELEGLKTINSTRCEF